MTKSLLSVLFVSAISLTCLSESRADVFVRSYFRSNGTYVRSHYRTSPDRSFYNNWSSYPNVNRYTGRRGTLRYPSYTPRFRSYSPAYRIRYYPRYRYRWGR